MADTFTIAGRTDAPIPRRVNSRHIGAALALHLCGLGGVPDDGRPRSTLVRHAHAATKILHFGTCFDFGNASHDAHLHSLD